MLCICIGRIGKILSRSITNILINKIENLLLLAFYISTFMSFLSKKQNNRNIPEIIVFFWTLLLGQDKKVFLLNLTTFLVGLWMSLKKKKYISWHLFVIFLAENIQGAGGSPVSWEHFFHSLMLYHEHLRKDLPSADSVQYRHLPLRGITQKEQDGLIAFLQLTTVIVNWVSDILFVIL